MDIDQPVDTASQQIDADNDAQHRDPKSLIRSLQARSERVNEGDHVILQFSDDRQMFAQATRGKALVPLRISKQKYSTSVMVGLPYFTVLEVTRNKLVPLPPDQDLMPDTGILDSINDSSEPFNQEQSRDNRNIVDNNTSQALDNDKVHALIQSGVDGSTIVKHIVDNSATFEQKTDFSRAKYIARKQRKYQLRCRIVRATGSTICQTMYHKDARKIMNLREDTLAQILCHANIFAGCQTLVWDHCQGIVTGAVAERMGGYGKQLSLYTGQQPNYLELVKRFNMSYAENFTIKWLHAGDVLNEAKDSEDEDKQERDALQWPCPLQEHTRNYVGTMKTTSERQDFLCKRSARFARKLTRHSPLEALQMLEAQPCDSIILAVKYDPTETMLALLPYLAPSCPFVVFCEYVEPLLECFQTLQAQNVAINLRLTDTWTREYQILPGRTHPNMNMSQNGGFLLVGTKLDEKYGINELDEDLIKEIREEIGGRRGRKSKKDSATATTSNGGKSSNSHDDKEAANREKDPKKARLV